MTRAEIADVTGGGKKLFLRRTGDFGTNSYQVIGERVLAMTQPSELVNVSCRSIHNKFLSQFGTDSRTFHKDTPPMAIREPYGFIIFASHNG